MKTANQNQTISKKLANMLFKQCIASVICFAVIYGMHCTNNTKISKYAESIGIAIRYDYDFSAHAKSVFNRIKSAVSPDNSTGDTNGITFQ